MVTCAADHREYSGLDTQQRRFSPVAQGAARVWRAAAAAAAAAANIHHSTSYTYGAHMYRMYIERGWRNISSTFGYRYGTTQRATTGLAISGAITYAVDRINNDPNVLPWARLQLRYNDAKAETVEATKFLIEYLFDGVSAIFGPEGPSCYVESIISQARNVPMFSHKCADNRASSIPTFIRIDPPDSQVIKSLLALLHYYNWRKFSIINEEPWQGVARTLVTKAHANRMVVNHQRTLKDRHECCERKMQCCHSGFWYQVIQETRNRTRIYVFLGTPPSLIDMMTSMQALQLFDHGEYMVIYVDMQTYSVKDAVRYLWKNELISKFNSCYAQVDFEKRARSLLVVAMSQPTQEYDKFYEKVREYNIKEPFNFIVAQVINTMHFKTFESIYAAYLYDAVRLYAAALDQIIREEMRLEAEAKNVSVDQIQLEADQILKLANNGTAIVQAIMKNQSYQSITGATIKLDKHGNSEGNFSVLALKPYNLTEHVNFSCSYHMLPVAQFQQGPNNTLEYKLIDPGKQVDWPGKSKPEDEPSCGFNNEKCPKVNTHEQSVVAAGTLGVLLFCATVVTASIYRKWKIEQEIEGFLMSAASFDSRCGPQIFASTGLYRNIRVRIKDLKFSKRKDCITREIMKEMRLLRELRHDNVNSFIGACIDTGRVLIITDYCPKGSLYDIIENEDIKLDEMFIASLIHDLIKGMRYLHNSPLIFHGNLKSSNCVVTSRWVLQVADFGLHELRQGAENDSIGDYQYYRNLLWKAPECLRGVNLSPKEKQKCDVYAFGIILYEIIGRRGPYGLRQDEEPPEDIVRHVKEGPIGSSTEPFRPDLNMLRESENGCPDYVLGCIRECWAEQPETRPDFQTIRDNLKKMRQGMHRNIMDQMMDMMVKYANDLEALVNERTRLLFEEKQKTEDLLHRMLPAPVASNLTRGIGIEPESFDSVTIYFSDIVGFTAMSAESTPLQVVNFLNDLYTLFDKIIQGYNVYKVETIGDAYMVVSGLPIKNGDRHAGEIASMALDLLAAVKNYRVAHRPNETLKLRIGMHTGPVVAGVVGLTMPRYCLFGDTVNTASRMESNGEPLRIHISDQCRAALLRLGEGCYVMEERGDVYLKGKGAVKTHWLQSGSVMGNPGGMGTPVRRRGVGNSLAMSSIQGSMALPQQNPSPANSSLIMNQPNNNNLSASLPPPATCSVETLATFPLNSLDLSSPGLSRSFDPFPQSEVKRKLKRDAKSLEDCAMTVSILPPTPPNSCILPNGGAVHEDEAIPLIPPKRWRSLEDGSGLVTNETNNPPLEPTDSEAKLTRGSLKAWLVGLLNGNNGLKGTGSQTSLRKNVYSLPSTTSSTPVVNYETQQQYSQLANGNDESIV
ncbi:hypothetical protein B566_EDAN010266 [Ephemera danica]|nr:hypothetical protein B566_EDAN010266 [Ephemera danica]